MCSACGIDGLAVVDRSAGEDAVNYGFEPGGFYTLYLTTSPGAPGTPPRPTDGTAPAFYAILDHVPAGVPDLDVAAALFQLGAGGIAVGSELTPPGTITVETAEAAYPDVQVNTAGRYVLPISFLRASAPCGDQFSSLAPQFTADTDAGSGTYDMPGLQNYAMEYDGNNRRVLTMAVLDASLVVLNFRQFLIEAAPGTEGLNVNAVNGSFRAQYIGAPVPLRCGGFGGVCRVSQGVGRVVLH